MNGPEDQVRACFESVGAPPGATLFCNHAMLGSTALLFTPQSAAIAQRFIESHGGALCDDPVARIFLVGNDSDRDPLTVPELTKPATER